MKKYIPFISLLVMFGCSKTPVSSPVNPGFTSTYKIATATGGWAGINTYTAKYTGNLLTALVAQHDSIVIAYNSDGRPVTKTIYEYNMTVPTQKWEFAYDGADHVISARLYGDLSGATTLAETAIFHYTGDKLSEMIVLNDTGAQNFRFVYTWTGGDITLLTEYDDLNNLYCTDTLSYDMSHANNIAVDFPDYRLLDPSYTPGLYEELFSTHPVIRMAHGCSGRVDSTHYSYDAAGRITAIDNGPTYAGYLFTYTP